MSPVAPRSPRAASSDLPPMPPSPPARSPATGGPPPLETNTLALVLPHPFLFSPPLQSLLREHYETYGEIRAWAPIRAFGRVIIVYTTFEAAGRAKREGDRLVLGEDDELAVEPASPPQARIPATGSAGGRLDNHSRVPSKLVLRLYCAAPTPLDPVLPSSQHLEPPPLTRNFLISPPGSPPEGWEPIVEDPPNSATLAKDLMAALEKLSSRAAKGEKEVIIQEAEAGVGVTVQDMTPDDDDDNDGDDAMAGFSGSITFDPSAEIFESEEGRMRGSIGLVRATVDSMGGSGQAADDSLFGGSGDAFAPSPNAFALGGDIDPVPRKAKIVPTPMPPMPTR